MYIKIPQYEGEDIYKTEQNTNPLMPPDKSRSNASAQSNENPRCALLRDEGQILARAIITLIASQPQP